MSTTPASGTAGNRPAAEVGQGSSLAVPRRSPAPRSFTYALRTRLRGARTANGWLACFVYDAPAPGWTPCAVVALCVCDRGASTRAPAPTDPANHVYDAPGCSYNTRDNVCNPSNYTYDARNSVYDTQNCLVAIIWTAVASPPTVDATPLCLKRAASATGHGPLAPTLVVASQARRPPAGQDAIPAPRPYILADDVLGQVSGVRFQVSGQRWLQHDGHGSTRLLTDGTGLITDRFSFDAYGMTLGGDPNVTNPAATDLLYSGEQFDAGLQQLYLRARYYDQGTGTFASLDPFAGNNGDPQSLHKYAYTHNDPINGSDPSGEFTLMTVLATVNVATGVLSALSGAAAAQKAKSQATRVAKGAGTLVWQVTLVRSLNAAVTATDRNYIKEKAEQLLRRYGIKAEFSMKTVADNYGSILNPVRMKDLSQLSGDNDESINHLATQGNITNPVLLTDRMSGGLLSTLMAETVENGIVVAKYTGTSVQDNATLVLVLVHELFHLMTDPGFTGNGTPRFEHGSALYSGWEKGITKQAFLGQEASLHDKITQSVAKWITDNGGANPEAACVVPDP